MIEKGVMKAHLYDTVKTLVDVSTDFGDRVIPAGTVGTVVECYEQPEGYAVDLAIPSNILVGGFEYENVILDPEQFIQVNQGVYKTGIH